MKQKQNNTKTQKPRQTTTTKRLTYMSKYGYLLSDIWIGDTQSSVVLRVWYPLKPLQKPQNFLLTPPLTSPLSPIVTLLSPFCWSFQCGPCSPTSLLCHQARSAQFHCPGEAHPTCCLWPWLTRALTLLSSVTQPHICQLWGLIWAWGCVLLLYLGCRPLTAMAKNTL